MKRKVVLHGPSTLTMSLPSPWIKRNSISKGDELDVTDLGSALYISSGGSEPPSRKISCDFSDYSEFTIKTLLASLHKSGYDEIEIFFEKKDTLQIVKKRIRDMLIGFEILDQTDKKCLIRSLADNKDKNLQNFLRRTFMVVQTMSVQTVELFTTNSRDIIPEIFELEVTSNRLTNYCHRLLNKDARRSHRSTYYFLIVWLLESICDDYRDMAKQYQERGDLCLDKDIISATRDVNSLLQDYQTLFFRFELAEIENIKNKYYSLITKLDSSLKESDRETIIITYLQSIARRIFDALGSTVGLYY